MVRVTNRVNRIYKGTVWSFNWLASLGVVAMLLLVTAGIISRRTPFGSITGVDELVEEGMAIVVFAPLAATQMTRGHIRIDVLTRRLPPRIAKWFEIIAWASGFAILSLMCWQISLLTLAGYETGARTGGAAAFPMTPFRAISAFGCGILAIQYLVDAIQSLVTVVNWKEDGG